MNSSNTDFNLVWKGFMVFNLIPIGFDFKDIGILLEYNICERFQYLIEFILFAERTLYEELLVAWKFKLFHLQLCSNNSILLNSYSYWKNIKLHFYNYKFQ